MAMKLSALRAGCNLPPGRFLVLISVKRPRRPQGHSEAGRIRLIEKSNDLIGNRTCDLPACSLVPQPCYRWPPNLISVIIMVTIQCFHAISGKLSRNESEVTDSFQNKTNTAAPNSLFSLCLTFTEKLTHVKNLLHLLSASRWADKPFLWIGCLLFEKLYILIMTVQYTTLKNESTYIWVYSS
jgi:hypothetical protein